MDSEGVQQSTVAGDCVFSSFWARTVAVYPPRQVKSAADRGAQPEGRGWTIPVSGHHLRTIYGSWSLQSVPSLAGEGSPA